MPIAMVRMLSVEISALFPVWHISPTLPIWFSVLCMAVLCGGRSIFPLFLLPHFPLSPFPFPLSPFPFPKCIFPWPLLLLTHFPHCPVVVLKVVFIFVLPCFRLSQVLSAVNNRCAIVFQTGGVCVFCFLWRIFSLGGGWKAPDSGGGGMGGSRGGVPVKNHLEERLLDQAQARASYTPLFWGHSRSIPQGMILDVQPLVKSLFCPIRASPNGFFDFEASTP